VSSVFSNLSQAQDRPLIEPDVEPIVIEEALIDTENFEAGVFFGTINIEDFESSLLRKDRIIIATKTDLEGTDEALAQLKEKYPDEYIIAISVFARTGLEELKLKMLKMRAKIGRTCFITK